MAAGDFLQGAFDSTRSGAIGALQGRRDALDREEKARQQKVQEDRQGIQDQLLKELRTAQVKQINQNRARTDRAQSERDATIAGEVDAFITEFPELEESRGNPQFVLARGTRLRQERDAASDVAGRVEVRGTEPGGAGGGQDEVRLRELQRRRDAHVVNGLAGAPPGGQAQARLEAEARLLFPIPGEDVSGIDISAFGDLGDLVVEDQIATLPPEVLQEQVPDIANSFLSSLGPVQRDPQGALTGIGRNESGLIPKERASQILSGTASIDGDLLREAVRRALLAELRPLFGEGGQFEAGRGDALPGRGRLEKILPGGDKGGTFKDIATAEEFVDRLLEGR